MRIIVSNASSETIYQQIVRQIKSQIIAGELSEGQPLPSIRGMAKELQVSVITTKRAYEELEREGFVDSVSGKGTFVAAQSREFLREQQLTAIEAKLAEAVEVAQRYGIEKQQLHEMIELLYGEVLNEGN